MGIVYNIQVYTQYKWKHFACPHCSMLAGQGSFFCKQPRSLPEDMSCHFKGTLYCNVFCLELCQLMIWFLYRFEIDLSNESNSLGAHRESTTNIFDMFVCFGLQINVLESLRDWSIAVGINAATSVIFLSIYTQYTVRHIYNYIYTKYIQYIYIFTICTYTYDHIYNISRTHIYILITCSHHVFLHLCFTGSKDTPRQSQKSAPSSPSPVKAGRQAIVTGGVDLQVAWKLYAKRTLGMIGFGCFFSAIQGD